MPFYAQNETLPSVSWKSELLIVTINSKSWRKFCITTREVSLAGAFVVVVVEQVVIDLWGHLLFYIDLVTELLTLAVALFQRDRHLG